MRTLVLRSVAAKIAACAAGLAAVGCSANIGAASDLADADVASASLAVVVVERTVVASETTRAEAVARFVRVRSGAVDDDALQRVGATVALPAANSCATLASLEHTSAATASRASRAARAVELLDVGAVSLSTPAGAAGGTNAALALTARRLPDVTDALSGVVYAARASEADAMPARGTYELKVAGTIDVAPFGASGDAPGEPSELFVGGKDARAGTVSLPAPSAAAGGAPGVSSVELTWEPGVLDDLVYVDVVGDEGSATDGGIRCSFPDSGRAALPAAVFGGAETGSLTLHRLHREPIRVRGMETGELRFDFARATAFTRRAAAESR